MFKDIELIILAAGSSSRMGMAKGLLEVDGMTLLEKTVEQALAMKITVRLVVAQGDRSYDAVIEKYMGQIVLFENERSDLGPFYSLQLGINGATKVLLTHVDRLMPPEEELKKLMISADIVQPYSHDLCGGHPIVLGQKVIDDILKVRNYSDVRLDHFLKNKKWIKKRVTVDHPFFFYNINTPEEYDLLLLDL